MNIPIHAFYVTFIAAIMVLLIFAESVSAQILCGQRNQIITTLLRNHAEVPIGRGFVNDSEIIEVLAAKNGSFTVLLTYPTGISCLIAMGQYWEFLSDPFRPNKEGREVVE